MQNPIKRALIKWLVLDKKFKNLTNEEFFEPHQEELKKSRKKHENQLKNELQRYLSDFEQTMDYKFEPRSHIKEIDLRAVLENQQKILAAPAASHWNKGAESMTTYFLGGFKVLYARAPVKELFQGKYITEHKNKHSYYELIIPDETPNQLLFRLNGDAANLKRVMRDEESLILPACFIKGKGTLGRAKKIQFTYGSCIKQGDDWKIGAKAELRYFC